MPKRDRICGTKTRHKTKVGAQIEAKAAVRAGMNVYRCPSCGFWHIGKTRDATRSADRITALLAKHERQLASRNERR